MIPPSPVLVAKLFPELGRELIGLLRNLKAEDWARPTVPPAPSQPIDGYHSLVEFLIELNAQ